MDSKQVGEISVTAAVILLRCQPRYSPRARILKCRKGRFHYDTGSKIGTQPYPKKCLALKIELKSSYHHFSIRKGFGI